MPHSKTKTKCPTSIYPANYKSKELQCEVVQKIVAKIEK